jgi:hypothetical protein
LIQVSNNAFWETDFWACFVFFHHNLFLNYTEKSLNSHFVTQTPIVHNLFLMIDRFLAILRFSYWILFKQHS